MRTDSSPLPRILLCDDSPVERLALAHFLRNNDFHVDEAGDGQSAILHLQHRPVDLVLLDLQMPNRDGFDVLTYMQQHRRALPVILRSGMPPDATPQNARTLRPRTVRDLLLWLAST